jgi:hypothetical protein
MLVYRRVIVKNNGSAKMMAEYGQWLIKMMDQPFYMRFHQACGLVMQDRPT